jgi:hypothetical protein
MLLPLLSSLTKQAINAVQQGCVRDPTARKGSSLLDVSRVHMLQQEHHPSSRGEIA